MFVNVQEIMSEGPGAGLLKSPGISMKCDIGMKAVFIPVERVVSTAIARAVDGPFPPKAVFDPCFSTGQ
jgi:hypothetical protein